MNWKNITVKLGDLKPWSDNPRQSTKAQAKRLLASWDKFGQVEAVAVGPELQVYDGHQRLSALLTVHGADYVIDARQSDTPLTDDERRQLVIMLHAGAVGEWDWDKLSAWQPAQLMESGFDADLLKGWKRDTSALQNFIFSNEETPDFQPVGIDEQGRLDQKKPVTCPECGHEFIPK